MAAVTDPGRHLPGFQAAEQFVREFNPLPDAFHADGKSDYDWVFTYAMDRYRMAAADFDAIDAKAAFVVTFVGGGVGVITAGTLALPVTVPAWVVACFAPSVVFAIAAVLLATAARWTRSVPVLPSGPLAIEYVEYHRRQSQAAFIPRINFATQMTVAVNTRKANLAGWSGMSAVVAVALLLVPLFAGIHARRVVEKSIEAGPTVEEIRQR